METSDFQINARVRSVLASHWIDLQRLRFGSFRGTVRLSGEVRLLCDQGVRKLDGSLIELLLADLRSIRGVVRVYLDASNWKTDDAGTLICLDRGGSRSVVGLGEFVLETTKVHEISGRTDGGERVDH
jgi:hypothetical protein